MRNYFIYYSKNLRMFVSTLLILIPQLAMAITKGVPVNSEDIFAKSTIQLYLFEVKTNHAGKKIVTKAGGCTGSLLRQDIILTDAHCTAGNSPNAANYVLTSLDVPTLPSKLLTAGPGGEPHASLIKVVSSRIHPNWSPSNEENKNFNWGDLAVLKLERPMPDYYQPVNIVSLEDQLRNGMDLWLAGFGMTANDNSDETDATTLQKADVKISNQSYSSSEFMVAGLGGKGACIGDSGGPAYLQKTDHTYAVAGLTRGIDKLTNPQGLCLGPTVYTSTLAYRTWINEQVATLSGK